MVVQRQIALSLALQPYLEGGAGALLSPLPQETELANLLFYADFYPQDGQLTLIEQLRDVITEHIPQEERAWLDPLKHSYLDLAEFLSVDEQTQRLVFRSIGDARIYRVPDGAFRKELQPGTGPSHKVDSRTRRCGMGAGGDCRRRNRVIQRGRKGSAERHTRLSAAGGNFRRVLRTRRLDGIRQALWTCAAMDLRAHAVCRAR